MTESDRSPSVPVVLLVDDHDEIRELIATFLRCSGFTVIQACNGVEALRSLAGSEPDIVVTDLMMPVMDGVSLCCEIRATERLAGIPIMAITAHSSFDADEAGAGFDKVISKGSGLDVLLRELRNALRNADTRPRCG